MNSDSRVKIFSYINNMISVTFDSVFHTLALLVHALMSFDGDSSRGINYHAIELKSASIYVSKICMTTETV